MPIENAVFRVNNGSFNLPSEKLCYTFFSYDKLSSFRAVQQSIQDCLLNLEIFPDFLGFQIFHLVDGNEDRKFSRFFFFSGFLLCLPQSKQLVWLTLLPLVDLSLSLHPLMTHSTGREWMMTNQIFDPEI